MSWRRCVIAVLIFLPLLVPPVQAHEIKVLASCLELDKPGGKATIYLSWGHRLPVDDLVDAATIEHYELFAPSGPAIPLKTSDLSLQENSVELKDPGLYQAVVVRKAGIYTTVVAADGTQQLKRGPKTTVKEGRIDHALRSQQCAKAVIVVGPPPNSVLKPLGHAIEFIPLDEPARWRSGQDLRFQVLLDGKPVAAETVVARYLGFKPDSAWCYSTTTDREGVATIRPSQAGTWVLKVNAKRSATGAAREQYDYDSYTATLTLEIRP
jgi:uncharacterized GH25 family protein